MAPFGPDATIVSNWPDTYEKTIETGETLWEVEGFGPGNAIAVGDTLVALSDAGEVVLVALDPKRYHELAA